MPLDSDAGVPRVLLVSFAPVGLEMAGTGIRVYEFAKALEPFADVTVAAVDSPPAEPITDLPLVHFSPRSFESLRRHLEAADVIVAPPHWPAMAPSMRRSRARLIFDIYCPDPLETLESLSHRKGPGRNARTTFTLDRLIQALRVGHHFIAASERQRDLWLGAMLAERLISPSTYDRDPSLRSVIDVVPYGVPADPPRRTSGPGPRERFPQIGADDEIVLWNASIWDWFDAPCAVRAIAKLAERRPTARLVFMCTRPGANRLTEETRALANRLGLLDRLVFFNDECVPYAERQNWLLDADCAISAHVDTLETRFAFRTRFLDCFWSRLPIACTRGDELGDRVQRDNLGATAPVGDPEALASAAERVLDGGRESFGPQLARVAAEHAWPRVAAPLVRYVTQSDEPRRPGSDLSGRLSQRPSHVLRNLAYMAVHRFPVGGHLLNFAGGQRRNEHSP